MGVCAAKHFRAVETYRLNEASGRIRGLVSVSSLLAALTRICSKRSTHILKLQVLGALKIYSREKESCAQGRSVGALFSHSGNEKKVTCVVLVSQTAVRLFQGERVDALTPTEAAESLGSLPFIYT